MFVKVLGAAAGGGFPQWNCCCPNCIQVRQASFAGTPRSQTQLAISADNAAWFLVNASPDLRYQIESFAALHPRKSSRRVDGRRFSTRHSPIHGILLTSAEIDAAMGLLLLRESQPLQVWATESVRRLLVEDNSIFGVLRRQPDQVRWAGITPGESFLLQTLEGDNTGMVCTPVATAGSFPGHVPPERAVQLDATEAVIGLFVECGGKQMAFFPGVASLPAEWLPKMADCDVIFFDGTFWSDDELVRLQADHGDSRGKRRGNSEVRAKAAREMGHLPVGDPGGALEQFSKYFQGASKASTRPRKIFIHINNTNPMLDESSPEYQQVRAAGWELAVDGMELQL